MEEVDDRVRDLDNFSEDFSRFSSHIRATSIFIAKTLYTYEIMWNGSGTITEVEM